MRNNLSMRTAVSYFQGDSPGAGSQSPVNYCGYNVALDSRDINGTDRRGFGFVLEGTAGSVVEFNIAAFQSSGTAAIDCFDFQTGNWAAIRGNVSWDWDGPNAGNPGWCTAFHFESGAQVQAVTGNTLVHHLNGMLIRWERPWVGTYSGNTYWTATPDGGVGGYQRFATNGGVGATLAQWRAATGDQSTFAASAPAQIAANIGDYLNSIGVNPGTDPVDTFMQKACLFSKQNDDPKYKAATVNAWIRGKFGVPNPTVNP
jgi:hypothetical protein